MGGAAGRPGGAPRRQEQPGAAGAPDPFDRGLRGPGLEGQPDARALERRELADRALPRHANRPYQLLPDVEPGRAAVRQRRARVEVPGAERTHRIRVPPRLHDRASPRPGFVRLTAIAWRSTTRSTGRPIWAAACASRWSRRGRSARTPAPRSADQWTVSL